MNLIFFQIKCGNQLLNGIFCGRTNLRGLKRVRNLSYADPLTKLMLGLLQHTGY